MRASLRDLRFVTVALSLCGLSAAQAAIAPPQSGNGELILLVRDPVVQVSYTLDLGIRMDDFFVLAQQNTGYQRFWVVDSPAFTSFLAQPTLDPSKLEWAVLGFDSFGPSTPGGQRLFTTVRQGSESSVNTWSNQRFTNGVFGAQVRAFFDNTNNTPSHGTVGAAPDFDIHGESVTRADVGGNAARAYFGHPTGLTPTVIAGSNAAPFSSINLVGSSSWFYYVTRSGLGNSSLISDRVLVDEFDNGSDITDPNQGNDGYWGFIQATNPATTLPEWVGKYLLSFTMPAFSPVLRAEARTFAASIGRTEYSGGYWTESLGGGLAGAAGFESPAAASIIWLAGAASALPGDPGLPALLGPLALLGPVTAVPEPRSAALLLLGLAALGWAAKRGARRPETLARSAAKHGQLRSPGSA